MVVQNWQEEAVQGWQEVAVQDWQEVQKTSRMASCSLYRKVNYPLMSRTELETILLFQRVNDDWVREVHMFSSNNKKGKNFVVFRDRNNKKVLGLKQLKVHLDQQGEDRLFLDKMEFKSDKDPEVVSNKVGANKIAKKQARDWINEVRK